MPVPPIRDHGLLQGLGDDDHPQYLTQSRADVRYAGIATADKSHTHSQDTALAVWVIDHNLNKFPSVVVVNSAGDEVIGHLHYDSQTRVTITFSGAFAGKAYLN